HSEGLVGEAHGFGEVRGPRRMTAPAIGVGVERFQILPSLIAGRAVGKLDCLDRAHHAFFSAGSGCISSHLVGASPHTAQTGRPQAAVFCLGYCVSINRALSQPGAARGAASFGLLKTETMVMPGVPALRQ